MWDYDFNLFAGIPRLGERAYAETLQDSVTPPKPVFTAEELATLGAFVKAAALKPEGARVFDLSDFRHMIPIYNESRADPMWRMTIMKAAQMTLTIWLLNRAFWWTADASQMVNTALLFPSKDSVTDLSATRFKPMLESSSRLQELVAKGGVDNVGIKRLGISNMYFRGMRSGIGLDSFPADVLLYDEVRLMSVAAVARARVRVSESTLRNPVTGERGIIAYNSTAGMPGADIHKLFMRSTQGYFATRCPDVKCARHKDGVVLPLEFVDNPANIIGQDPHTGWYYLRCPKCGARIADPQEGFYRHALKLADAEEGWGFQFSQFLKGEGYLNGVIMPDWNAQDNVPEFINSRVGLPYENPDAVPASEKVVRSNIDPTGLFRWEFNDIGLVAPLGYDGLWRAMGVDQRAGEKHVVIKTLLPDGRHRLDYTEIVEKSGADAVSRLEYLAIAWGCKIMLMDGEPAYDLFVSVARRLAGRVEVWLQDYVGGVEDVVRWQDKRNDKQLRRSSGELKWEQVANMNRYRAIDWSLNLWVTRRNLLPTNFDEVKLPRTLRGVETFRPIAEEFIKHMGNIARVKNWNTMTDQSTGQRFNKPGDYTMEWRPIDFDPHFVHANMYADVGLKKMWGINSVFVAGGSDKSPKPNRHEQNMPPSIAPSVVKKQLERALAKTCGICVHFDAAGGRCAHPAHGTLSVRTTATSPACKYPGFKRSPGVKLPLT